MNVFGFNTVDLIAGLFTFAGGGIFFGFLLMFIKFVMFGFMSNEFSWDGKEVKTYD